MELLKCRECGSTDLEFRNPLLICRFCGASHLLPGRSEDDNRGESYIDRTHEAIEMGAEKKALDYSEKALLYLPHSGRAWRCRWYALQCFEDIDNRYHLDISDEMILDAAEKAIRYAKQEEKDSFQREIYGLYLGAVEFSVNWSIEKRKPFEDEFGITSARMKFLRKADLNDEEQLRMNKLEQFLHGKIV